MKNLEVQCLVYHIFYFTLGFLSNYSIFALQFGDHDGVGSEVLLQHPLGVSCGKDGQIYVADSYNHKVVTDYCAKGIVEKITTII